ncbi:MAG: B12-binding domain-containing radical SAM protein [Candidatus Bathyarchaeia archaeon]
MKVLFVEPPKEYWFVMGEYLPPPLGILELAAYLESRDKNVEIEVVDCQARQFDWKKLERYIESSSPDIVAPSALATCNAYTVLRTAETAKKVNPNIKTVVGGQHFTATAQEALKTYSEIDIIIRGEGEQTFAELVQELKKKEPSISKIKGISFRQEDKIVHNPPRPLIENLDDLPFPGYHFVKDYMNKYHFAMMAGAKKYALIEGSRGCPHKCTFCSQWKHWRSTWRIKSAKRIADEFEYCYNEFGSSFLWLTDDNFGLGKHASALCDEIINRGIADDIMWFMQVRCDDIIKHKHVLPKMRKAGNRWMLMGIESGNVATLKSFNKRISPKDAAQAIKLLKENGIFAQATLIIGERKESAESIAKLREFINHIDPDLAIFMVLTPFPGTELYETAKQNGWIEDTNWSHYDMAHAIMPTETLSRKEVQEELYQCYRSFYGSASRRLKGLFSRNKLKRRTYRYLASQGLLKALRDLF